MLFRKPQQPHTASVGLLFDLAGGKDRVNDLTCVCPDLIRPSTETVAVPLQIFLVVFGHVSRDRRILAGPAEYSGQFSIPSPATGNHHSG